MSKQNQWYLIMQKGNPPTCSGCGDAIPPRTKMAFNPKLYVRLCMTCVDRAGITDLRITARTMKELA